MIYTAEETLDDLLDDVLAGTRKGCGMGTADGYEVLAWPYRDEGKKVRYRFVAILPGRVPDHAFGTVSTYWVDRLDDVAHAIGASLSAGRPHDDFDWSTSSTEVARIFEAAESPRSTEDLISRFSSRLHLGSLMASQEWQSDNKPIAKPVYGTMLTMPGLLGEIVRSRPGDTWLLGKDLGLDPHCPYPVGRTAAEAFARAIDRDNEPTPAMLKAIRLTDLCRFDANYDWQVNDFIRAARTLPPEWLPSISIPESDEVQLEEWEAAINALNEINVYALATGRTTRSVVGSFRDDWISYAHAVCSAAGVGSDEDDAFYFATQGIDDMVRSFEDQVVRPALHRRGVVPAYDDFEKRTGRSGGPGRFSARAMALLVGDRTLSRMAEVSGSWHTRTTAMSELEASLCPTDVSWRSGLPTKRLKAGDETIEIRPLESLGALVDEGASTEDADGLLGLDHCIASYARSAAFGAGAQAILSIRSIGPAPRRLSTAYVEFGGEIGVVSHHGPRNARPSPTAMKALEKYVEGTPVPSTAQPLRLDRPSLYDPATPGSVEAMLEAWSFAMPGNVRSMTVDELVDFCLQDDHASGNEASTPAP